MIDGIKQLRKDADTCTQMAGVDDNFETVWITKSALLEDIDAIEREVEERYIELPKDADGEYIHIGDRVEDNERVARIVLTNGSWEPSVYVEKAPCLLEEHFCYEVSHYHEPTVDDVLLEACKAYHGLMTESMSDVAHDMPAPSEVIAKYAAKLQLKEEK